MKLNKLKSFTILEALIGLLLISVIIGLVYTFLNFMGKQMSVFKEDNIATMQYNLFNVTMQRDIAKAVSYHLKDDVVVFKYFNNSEIEYSTYRNKILRTTESGVDTLGVDCLRFRLEQEKLNNGNIKILVDTKFLNDTIKNIYFLNQTTEQAINEKYLK